MDVKQIERLMAAMENHGVTELKWSEGEELLVLARGAKPQIAAPGEKAASDIAPAPDREAGGAVAPNSTGDKEILSPMVGIFHPAPKPVKVGARLKKGDVLCVIEAMKLMNDITMDEDGEIVFLALAKGDMVEFGQVLAQYKPM